MPNLKDGERMQRCECQFHSKIRKQKYYVVRKYYGELENHFCAGCCKGLEILGLVTYSIDNGYTPRSNITVDKLLDAYGEGVKK